MVTEDEALKRALENCSRDPIHIPGAIQGFGILVAYDAASETINHISANATNAFDAAPQELLGTKLRGLFSKEHVHDIRNALGHETITSQRELVQPWQYKTNQFLMSVHQKGENVLLELFPEVAGGQDMSFGITQARAVLSEPLNDNLDEFLELTTEQVRVTNGYDRTKFYRFLPDGSGEIVAESRRPGIESFMGMRFPAADIPAIARKLYTTTPLRIIHDIYAQDVPLLAAEKTEALDMSLAVLRGLDAVHRQYLSNIGVASTLTIPIVVDGALWGMFACHNETPKPPDPSVLAAVELIGKVVGLKIQHYHEAQKQKNFRHCSVLASKIIVAEDSKLALKRSTTENSASLMELVDSDGFVLRFGGQFTSFGDVPNEAALAAVFSLTNADSSKAILADDLQDRFPNEEWGKTGGAAVFSLPGLSDTGFAFLRNLAKTKVTWAGSPEKSVIVGPGGPRLTPRNSFEAYLEESGGKSTPWSADEIAVVTAFLKALENALIAQDLTEENRHRLGLMVHELNHRVRNILALVQTLSQHTREEAFTVKAYAERLEQRIVALAGAHNLLTRTDMNGALLPDLVMLELQPYMRIGNQVSAQGPPLVINADAASVIALLFHELVSNAAKYGALVDGNGSISVSWELDENGVKLTWQESCETPVIEPTQSGFGLSIIKHAVPYELGGKAELEFRQSGIVASYLLPRSLLVDTEVSSVIQSKPTKVDVQQESEALEQDLSGKVALVAEDNFVIARLNRTMLRDLGFGSIDLAASVDDAITSLGHQKYDVCLLDVNLRGELSVEVAKELERTDTPYVFTTGYGSDGHEVVHEFSAPFLAKPFTQDSLRKVLKTLIKRN